ncbi:class I SAM-dependent methyltransferase [Leptospira sp. GIMC2001]|uniref:class I SAM-dependent methyltransferase n=1 Tax=Leptospira sp. GIMC2001 TaxID=1513297 RepID=UPI002349C7F9|nr:methyltransferase domain-containing protein [Leptospira sp. GIMC2001]WCL48448.1 SAM-dependent methyltransferase [Leptospira sp. GIMC2001]
MAELEYYENIEYQNFLLSSKRREICPPEAIFDNFKFNGVENLVDFGAGKGFFIPEFRKVLSKEAWIWAAECQQELLDHILKRKIEENIPNLTPFFIERSDHPLLPEWIPQPDLVFSSLCLSTFPNPGLAMDGLIRSMRPGGRLIILDWNKHEYDIGPRINDKISQDKMMFLAEDYKLKITKHMRIKEYFYILEVVAGANFEWGYYDLKEEEADGGIWEKS